MDADPDAIRALARTLHDQGEEVRAEGRRLVALLDATAWSGRAAEAAGALARRRCDDLEDCAARHEDAARALALHAEEVEHRLALLARAGDLVDGVGGLVGDGLGHLRDLLPDGLPGGLPDGLPGRLIAGAPLVGPGLLTTAALVRRAA